MTGKAVQNYATPLDVLAKLNETNTTTTTTDLAMPIYTPIEVATTVTFMVGIIQVGFFPSWSGNELKDCAIENNYLSTIFQLGMYLFRLGIISTLLSETLVNGFTTGAAVHVLISQIKDLLGLHLKKQSSVFKLIFVSIKTPVE